MKATKKMFGAVALSAALALGTAVPAFAAETDDEQSAGVEWKAATDSSEALPGAITKTNVDKDTAKIKDGTSDDATDGTGSTTPVFIATNVSQIQVAVPVKLVMVAESAGGALTPPSSNAYKIANYSTNAPIYITHVKCTTPAGSGWTLVDAKNDGTNNVVGAGVLSSAAKGTAYIEMDKPLAASETANAKGLTASTDATIPNDICKANWMIAKATDGGDAITAKTLPINFSGETSAVNGINGKNLTPEQVLNVTYTVSMAPTPAVA